jgi:hypothetical protein
MSKILTHKWLRKFPVFLAIVAFLQHERLREITPPTSIWGRKLAQAVVPHFPPRILFTP